jgi:hypothetical protein
VLVIWLFDHWSEIMMRKNNLLILCILFTLSTLTACSSDGTTGSDTDGDQEAVDGDASDGDDPDGDLPDGDTTDVDKTDGDATDGDATDGDTSDGDDPDGDQADGDGSDGDGSDGDDPDGDVETPPEQAAPNFNGFTSSGGTATSDDYRLTFRLAPAAITMKATGGGYRMNATITPKSN